MVVAPTGGSCPHPMVVVCPSGGCCFSPLIVVVLPTPWFSPPMVVVSPTDGCCGGAHPSRGRGPLPHRRGDTAPLVPWCPRQCGACPRPPAPRMRHHPVCPRGAPHPWRARLASARPQVTHPPGRPPPKGEWEQPCLVFRTPLEPFAHQYCTPCSRYLTARQSSSLDMLCHSAKQPRFGRKQR